MTTFKARLHLRNGLRDATVESDSEWEGRELLAAQYGIEKRDVLLIKRIESWTGSGSLVSNNSDDTDNEEEAGVAYKFATGIVGLGFWAAVAWIAIRAMA